MLVTRPLFLLRFFVWQTGLAWFSGESVEKLRHACQDSDGLEKWGWQRHNGR